MVSAVTSVIEGLIGSNQQANASKDAASLQSAATNQANSQSWAEFQQQQKNLQPWITSGTGAVNTLADLVGTSGNTTAADYGSLTKPFSASDFTADPGYQFSVDQGQKALERSAAAKGGLLSGAALKAAQTYGQGTAAQEYNDVYNRYVTNQTNTYNRLAGIAGTGQNAVNNIGNAGQTAAANSGNLITQGANAQAAGTVGAANNYSTGLGNAFSTVASQFNPMSYLSTQPGTFFS